MAAAAGDTIPAAGMGRITLRQRERGFRGQGIDRHFFNKKFDKMRVVDETTTYLEILNYTDGRSLVESQALRLGDDFDNFLTRKASDLFMGYSNLLNFQRMSISWMGSDWSLETSTVVGPFCWWAHHEDDAGKHLREAPARSNAHGHEVAADLIISLELVFRKSDVQWVGNPRGWQMTLSYSFNTGVTSGFLKGTANADLGEILANLKSCGSPAHHPLLLPVLMLCQELGPSNDEKQRKIRNGIRELDMVLTGNYRNVPAAAGHISHGDLTLDKISQKIADYQAKVNWKRPQAWRNVLGKIQDATEWVRENTDTEDPSSGMGMLHLSLMDRLRFYHIKLDGLENYAHVSLARLDNLRQVVRIVHLSTRVANDESLTDNPFFFVNSQTNGLISQVESRLNAEIAIQQHLLANASKRDSASMKTLTLLGAVFLPGTFLSSMFSMPFFEFHDMDGPVSRSLWIYIVLTFPLTGLVVLIWWWIDQRMARRFGTGFSGAAGLPTDETGQEDNDDKGAEEHLNRLEGQILERIRHRTGAQLTRTFTLTRSYHSRPSRPVIGVEAGDGSVSAGAAHTRSRRGRLMRGMARMVPGVHGVQPSQRPD
ncbi:hypothetical protein PG991_010876 [Apiospora marii]|uniref:Mg2+ transporter protein, CorA-like/Zinc transport protein ZntB n=1 Tax=Apiospora marii TaxID=335849 RepID=A0ABR1RCU5_9PEZI